MTTSPGGGSRTPEPRRGPPPGDPSTPDSPSRLPGLLAVPPLPPPGDSPSSRRAALPGSNRGGGTGRSGELELLSTPPPPPPRPPPALPPAPPSAAPKRELVVTWVQGAEGLTGAGRVTRGKGLPSCGEAGRLPITWQQQGSQAQG